MALISVICAAPPGPNPGMASVDLAFHRLCRRSGLAAGVDYCHLYTPEEIHARRSTQDRGSIVERQRLPFEPVCFRDRLDRVYSSDAVLFWGDFLHAFDYRGQVADIVRQLGLAPDAGTAIDLVDRHLFLRDAPDGVLGRCLSFGGTMLFNRGRDYQADPVYTANLTRLARGLRRVWMRDVYSALTMSRLRGDFSRSNLGVDCSLLLRPGDLDELPRSAWSADAGAGGKVGVFFGRSGCPPKALGRFARDLCRKLDRPAQWLPWGDALAFGDTYKQVRKGFRGLELREVGEPVLPGDLYALLAGYSLVVSDTYHVCVNAWRLGVPAVCVGEAVSKARWSVSSGNAYAWRDKRQVFYAMNDAMDYYVYGEELVDRSWQYRRVYQLWQLLREPAIAAGVVARLHDQRDKTEAELVAELRALLGS